MKKLVPIVGLLCACSAAGEVSLQVETEADTAAIAWPVSDDCNNYALSPDADIFGWALRTRDRWELASGCHVTLLEESGGIPVRWVPEIIIPEHLRKPGGPDRAGGVINGFYSEDGTAVAWLEILISTEVHDPLLIMTHEFGHMLGAKHGDGSIMDNGAYIEEHTLNAMCSRSTCPGPLRPESPPEVPKSLQGETSCASGVRLQAFED